jgi:hypothetical protein
MYTALQCSWLRSYLVLVAASEVEIGRPRVAPCLLAQELALLHHCSHASKAGSRTDEKHVTIQAGRLKEPLLDPHGDALWLLRRIQ